MAAGAASLKRNLVEAFKNALLVFEGYATASIPYLYLYQLLILIGYAHTCFVDYTRRNRYFSTWRCKAYGIADKITQHLLDTIRVGINGRNISGDINPRVDATIQRYQFKSFYSAGHNFWQTDQVAVQTQLPGIGTRDKQKIFNKGIQVFAAATRPLHKFELLLIQFTRDTCQGKIKVAIDSVERRAQFMGNQGEEVCLHAGCILLSQLCPARTADCQYCLFSKNCQYVQFMRAKGTCCRATGGQRARGMFFID